MVYMGQLMGQKRDKRGTNHTKFIKNL